MRTLIIVRHGKSSWKNPGLRDFDRPLSPRGVRNAVTIGNSLKTFGVTPCLIVTSPAERAKHTAIIIAGQLEINPEDMIFRDRIYEASVSDLTGIISDLDEHHRTVLIIGHNPAFTGLSNRLQETSIPDLPTCGAIGIRFTATDWKEAMQTVGKCLFQFFPKNL